MRASGRLQRRALLALAGVIVIAPLDSPGEAMDAPGPERLPPVTDPAWEPVSLPGVEHETLYRAAEDGKALRAEAECSASARVLPLSSVDLRRTPVLRWRWRVEQGLDTPDERTREGDDFAARVSVLFPFEPERAGWIERLRRGISQSLADRELPGTALYFVWTARVAPGTLWQNPYAAEVMTWAVRRGPSEGWREEAVDVSRRYREAFGRAPPRPAALGVMTDADNQCARAVALYADFRFTPTDERESPPLPSSRERSTSR